MKFEITYKFRGEGEYTANIEAKTEEKARNKFNKNFVNCEIISVR